MTTGDRAPILYPRSQQTSYGSAPASTKAVFEDPSPYNPNYLGGLNPASAAGNHFPQAASRFQSVDPPPLPPKPGQQQPVDQLQHQVQGMNLHGNRGHASQDYPGTAGEGMFSDPRSSSQLPHSHPSHIPSTLSSTKSSMLQDTDRKKDDEIHILRMIVSDKEAQIKKITSQLDLANEEIRKLNVQLQGKKEAVLKYQEKISDLTSDHSSLQQHHTTGPTPTEAALHSTIQQLRQQLTDQDRQLHLERQRIAELQRRLSEPPPPLPKAHSHPHNGSQAELQSLRQQLDFLHNSRDSLQRENEGLRSQVELLSHQVMTYNEDFQSERSDRERAQSKIQSMREETESLRQAINLLATEHGIRLDAYGLQPPGNRN